MTELIVTIDSLAVETLLNQLATRTGHLQPALNAIGHTLATNIDLTFRDLKSPEGVPWKALSPVTKFNRAKRIAGNVYIKSGKRTTKKFTDVYLSADLLHHHVVNTILATAGIIDYDALNYHLLPDIALLNEFITQTVADVKRTIK